MPLLAVPLSSFLLLLHCKLLVLCLGSPFFLFNSAKLDHNSGTPACFAQTGASHGLVAVGVAGGVAGGVIVVVVVVLASRSS